MVKLLKINPLKNEQLEKLGFTWHTDNDNSKYISDSLVKITQNEAEAYYEAVNEIYDMYAEAAEYVIENNLFFELGIPFNLIEAIKKSWESDVHWHVYGRFDLAGGLDSKPIKLIEFNADTPTALFETALLQWALLKENGMNEDKQFNNVYESIKQNFKRLITLFDDTELFDERYDGWKILFSSIHGNDEEEATTRLLQQIATDAGFNTGFEYLGDVRFDEDGIYDRDENQYEYWFKLYPWEDIAVDEPELATTLTNIMQNQNAIILNPAYTLLFQSKGMLKILYDLFPDSPYLLKTSFEPLKGIKYVEKSVFGREGANVKIVDADGIILNEQEGPYGNYKKVYQEYVDFNKDENGSKYQAGVFFAYEACGMGFRKGGEIMNNMSKFVGHVIV
ncbi:MAG: glutathionylspermidine synthase [Sulfurimonas sp. RIFCSPLOWO2_12_36_12]|uniref:glutathionylspermidine synthase family protein n=1 Tax=Sulfurimonas sp. RIFCSPLOWO2_12_36_12 TaxID=1802253 RepID=UPI0008C0DFAA|nr:glutathionylspermidine synthase family protein [Sulfurimonas sp. RIFCSPLOWO2_12_36_12]OHD98165.1 MAG: glutathionylspermidine synthase [Sulfurimonas sp. RIFCSPLOWO2_02_FULL_36_28]OHE02568.1 MAG: glutathionylspermidine synthase [Sulfurimonas sp. RIFCSPLOWO2_12_36_12]